MAVCNMVAAAVCFLDIGVSKKGVFFFEDGYR
jgi:hypothetical protein